MGKIIFLFFLASFVFGLAGGILTGRFLNQGRSPVYLTETKEVRIQENTALTEAVGKVAKTVIGVRVRPADQSRFEGSALSVTNDGLIITLNSLLPRGEKFLFLIDGQAQPYQVLKRDAQLDLVLVKLEVKNLAAVAFADPEKLKLGQRIFLVAYDFQTQGRRVNEGIISRLGPDFLETNIIEKHPLEGSPLFDIEGNLVGLSFLDQDSRVSAIPVKQIKTFTGF